MPKYPSRYQARPVSFVLLIVFRGRLSTGASRSCSVRALVLAPTYVGGLGGAKPPHKLLKVGRPNHG